MKFVADVMLGRLATWLRLLGHDVLYNRSMDDRGIIRLSREQDRKIITRDTGLIRNKAVRDCIFITSDHVLDQLAEMKEYLGSDGKALPMRCAHCNGELESVTGNADFRERVPDYVFHAFHRFLQCRICRNVYWEGSHYRHIKATLRHAIRLGP